MSVDGTNQGDVKNNPNMSRLYQDFGKMYDSGKEPMRGKKTERSSKIAKKNSRVATGLLQAGCESCY